MPLQFFETTSRKNSSKNPKNLVIFLHGYGSNGANLIELAKEFDHILPEAHFISPNAPQNWEGGFIDCYQWFSLASLGTNDMLRTAQAVKKSNEILRKFINKQLERFKLSPQHLFIVGFSQGAMMSMYQGLSMPQKPAGIISYSGKLILPEFTGEKTLIKPDICLIHGKQDSVLPFSNFIEAEKILKEQQIPFESHAFDNLDHTIDIHGIRVGMRFIEKILKEK